MSADADAEFKPVMSAELVDQLSRDHVAWLEPRPGNEKSAVDCPRQCQACLLVWPCPTRLLLDRVIELEAVIIEAAYEISLTEDAYRKQFGDLPEDGH